jgi:methylated-DNA-protein-cysteine methyltransferase-like protein
MGHQSVPGRLEDGVYQRVYRLVAKIPSGRVATYGQIASMVPGCTARQVGYALAATPDGIDIPWHRVINARGEVSTRSGGGESGQKKLLADEGIVFLEGRVRLQDYGWEGPDWRWLEKNGYRVFPD